LSSIICGGSVHSGPLRRVLTAFIIIGWGARSPLHTLERSSTAVAFGARNQRFHQAGAAIHHGAWTRRSLRDGQCRLRCCSSGSCFSAHRRGIRGTRSRVWNLTAVLIHTPARSGRSSALLRRIGSIRIARNASGIAAHPISTKSRFELLAGLAGGEVGVRALSSQNTLLGGGIPGSAFCALASLLAIRGANRARCHNLAIHTLVFKTA